MTNEEVVKGMNNPNAQAEAMSDYDLAKKSLEQADAKQLFQLYEKAIEQRGTLLKTIAVLSEHYGGGASPRFRPDAPPDEKSITAIKEVALAAIKFANDAIKTNRGEAI